MGGEAGPPGRPAAGDSAETGAISRRLPGRPLRALLGHKNRTQTSGAGRSGAGQGEEGGPLRRVGCSGLPAWSHSVRTPPPTPSPPPCLRKAKGWGGKWPLCPTGTGCGPGAKVPALTLGDSGAQELGCAGLSRNLGMEHSYHLTASRLSSSLQKSLPAS